MKINSKKTAAGLAYILLIFIGGILWSTLLAVLKNHWLLTSVQIITIFVLLYRASRKEYVNTWEWMTWFILFPCYFIYAGENGYQSGWYSRVSDVVMMGISGPFLSILKLSGAGNSLAVKTVKLAKEDNAMLVYQIYSVLFFFVYTALIYLKKNSFHRTFDILKKSRTSMLFMMLLFISGSAVYHGMSSETDKAFRYSQNTQLWNVFVGYVSLYLICVLLFIVLRKRIAQTSVASVCLMFLLLFFPVISVSSAVIETYGLDDGKVRAGREVVISPLFHALTVTVITFFEDTSAQFAYINIHAIRQFTIFQIGAVLLMISRF